VRRGATIVSVAAAGLAATVAAAPAGAGEDDARCDGRTPTRLEREYRESLRFRRSFDLPRSRRHILFVLRTPRYRRASADWGVPLTRSEQRYLARRARVEDGAGALGSYARRHPGTSGGISIEDDYRRGPYVMARFTRDLDRHRRALRRIARVRFRVTRVRFTERALDRLQERVGDDLEALEREGIAAQGVWVDVSENRVVVPVITKRRDAAAFVRARHGPGVKVEVIATEPYREVCVALGSYRAEAGATRLRVFYFTNSAYEFLRVVVRETEREVRVAVIERSRNGFVTSAGANRQAVARLERPLGDRRVVDAETGRRLRARR
jgi:hypothetical protein